MHHVIRRIALPLLAALALTPATALADDAFQDLSNGAPGGPAFVPPPPPRTARSRGNP